jgi:hypothetical protein
LFLYFEKTKRTVLFQYLKFMAIFKVLITGIDGSSPSLSFNFFEYDQRF